jgi:hypothetical protein
LPVTAVGSLFICPSLVREFCRHLAAVGATG